MRINHKPSWVVILLLVAGMGMLTGCTPVPATVTPHPQDSSPTPPNPPPTQEPPLHLSPTPTSTTAPTLPQESSPMPQSIAVILPGVSAKYTAATEDEAREVARVLNFVGNNYEDPSNMCGPLAFALLRDAGVIDKYVDLHDVWLLDPSNDQRILEVIFPRERFEWFSFREPTYEFDFEEFPLQAGDLLFLYAGRSGTFQHVLTVTRTDEEGRAFSVTNVNTDAGYVIEERLLYDPLDPEAGLFNRWVNRQYLMLGLTGFGGFDLWRPKSEYPQYPGDLALAAEIDKVIDFAGGEWHALVKAIPDRTEVSIPNTEVLYTRLANSRIHIASVVKVPIAMLLFSAWEDEGIPEEEIAHYIQEKGPGGRTFEQLLQAMLVKSEENAADVLYAYLNQKIDINAKLAEWGIENADLYDRKFTTNDVAHLFELLYRGEALSPASKEIILAYMAEYTSNDDLRIGAIRPDLPDDWRIYNKRGSLTYPLVVGDAAILENPRGDDYFIALFAFQGNSPTTYERLESALGDVANVIWGYISEEE